MDVIGPLSTAPFYRSILPLHSPAPFSGPAGSGFRVSEFRIWYGVWAGA